MTAGVEALAKLTTLEKLNLMGLGPLKGKTISMLTKLSRLRALNLSISQLQDKHVLAITRIGKPRFVARCRSPGTVAMHISAGFIPIEPGTQ